MFLLSYVLFNEFIYGMVYKLYYSNKGYRKLISNWSLKKIEMPKDILSKYTKIQARIGLAQLRKLEKMIMERKILAKVYDKKLKNVKRIVKAPVINGASYSHYAIRVKNRKEFVKRSEKEGLPIGRSFDFDYVVPYTPAYKLFGIKEKFVNSSIAAKEIVNLPFRPDLSRNQINFILDAVKNAGTGW